MARARNIKPGFFSNEELVELDMATRLLFIGLWTIADRDGRMEDRPKRIKMQVFPADDVDIDASLAKLADRGFIQRYEVNGMHCIQIVNWNRHQNPHARETESVIAPPEGYETVTTTQYVVPADMRERVFARDGFRCKACDTKDRLTIDHIVPRSKGGSNDEDNLQVLCMTCNSSKNNREAPQAVGTTTKARPRHDQGTTKAMPSPADSLIPDSLIPDSGLSDSEGAAFAPETPAPDPPPQPANPKAVTPAPKPRSSRIADDFAVNDAMRQWANEAGYTPQFVAYETEKFRDYYASSPKTYLDWPATWRNWLRRSAESNPQAVNRNAPPSPSNVKPFQKRYETPADRTAAAFDTFFAELDGVPPDPYADHEVIDVKVSGS